MPRTLSRLGLTLSLALASGVPVQAQGPTPVPVCATVATSTATAISAPSTARPPLLPGRWRRLPKAPIGQRDRPVVVWTGSEMLVWGGAGIADQTGAADSARAADGVGAAYDPATRRWRRMPTAPIEPVGGMPAVWTGTELVVWGARQPGAGASAPADAGAAYDPATNRWRPIAVPVGPSGAASRDAAWTGAEMLVWGWTGAEGHSDRGLLAYAPTTDTWRILSPAPIGGDSLATSVAWTGSEAMIVDYEQATLGEPVEVRAAAWSPATAAWRDMGTLPMSGSSLVDARIADDQMLLLTTNQWGTDMTEADDLPPADLTLRLDSGCVQTPRQAPWSADAGSVSAWSGSDLMFPGAHGLVYRPADDRWRRLPRLAGIADDSIESATWAGDRLIVLAGPFLPDMSAASPRLAGFEFVPEAP